MMSIHMKIIKSSNQHHFQEKVRSHFPHTDSMPVLTDTLRYRVATPADIPRLRALIDRSVRELQAQDYTPAQLDGALGTYLGVDTQLIADGTYFVVEAPNANPETPFIASGGGPAAKPSVAAII